MTYNSTINPEKLKTKIVVNQLGFSNPSAGYIWDSRMFDWKDYDLWIILGGKGVLQTADDTFNLQRGTCISLKP
jgi:hypothetical protein